MWNWTWQNFWKNLTWVLVVPVATLFIIHIEYSVKKFQILLDSWWTAGSVVNDVSCNVMLCKQAGPLRGGPSDLAIMLYGVSSSTSYHYAVHMVGNLTILPQCVTPIPHNLLNINPRGWIRFHARTLHFWERHSARRVRGTLEGLR